jgi:homoserine kinase type II
MLWAHDDPGTVLAERFGFGSAEAAGRWVAATLEERWDVEVGSVARVVMSDANALAWVDTPRGRVLAKWSVATERFARLAALARVTTWLGAQGFPVSDPVPASDGRLQVEVDGVSLGVQREVHGRHLDTAVPEQVAAAGTVLARLHDLLAEAPDAVAVSGTTGPVPELATRVTEWLARAGDHVPVAARERLHRGVAALASLPTTPQLVHGDFRAANVLCRGTEVAAVLDLAEAGTDHRVVDLARSAVLLGTRFHDWGPVSSEVRAGFRDAYEAVRPLTPLEARWFDPLVLWFSLALVPAGADPTGWARAVAEQVGSD